MHSAASEVDCCHTRGGQGQNKVPRVSDSDSTRESGGRKTETMGVKSDRMWPWYLGVCTSLGSAVTIWARLTRVNIEVTNLIKQPMSRKCETQSPTDGGAI